MTDLDSETLRHLLYVAEQREAAARAARPDVDPDEVNIRPRDRTIGWVRQHSTPRARREPDWPPRPTTPHVRWTPEDLHLAAADMAESKRHQGDCREQLAEFASEHHLGPIVLADALDILEEWGS